MTEQRRTRDWREPDDDRFPGRDDPKRRDPRSAGRREDDIDNPRGQRSWREEVVERPGSFMPNYDPDYEERFGGRAYGYGAGGRGTESFGRDERDRRQPHHDERSLWDRGVDEVSSWLGDDRAQARRQLDQFRGRGPKNYARADHRIHEDVCDRLTEAGAIDASDISVEVAQGEVTLAGTVPTRDQRRAAEDCSECVTGVRHVQNNLRVAEQGQRPMASSNPERSAQAERPDNIGGAEFGPGPGSTR